MPDIEVKGYICTYRIAEMLRKFDMVKRSQSADHMCPFILPQHRL